MPHQPWGVTRAASAERPSAAAAAAGRRPRRYAVHSSAPRLPSAPRFARTTRRRRDNGKANSASASPVNRDETSKLKAASASDADLDRRLDDSGSGKGAGSDSTLSALEAVLGAQGSIVDEVTASMLEDATWVDAPLKRVSAVGVMPTGTAYRSLALRFPFAATSRQRKEGQRGVSLDFIIDTGSTVNVLMPAVAAELGLAVDQEATPAGVSASGYLAGATQFVLGDCQLDHLAEDQRFTFMTGLKASGLSVPSPGAAGILGRAFLDCFPAVELRLQEGIVRFHSEWDTEEALRDGALAAVDAQPLGETGLWGIPLSIGGGATTVMALLDTGSPVTVLNKVCAKQAGLGSPELTAKEERQQQEKAEDDLQQKSFLGRLFAPKKPMPPPLPPMVPAHMSTSLAICTSGERQVELGTLRPMVGDPSGLSALGMGGESPGAIMGLDALAKRKRVVLVPGEQRMLISVE